MRRRGAARAVAALFVLATFLTVIPMAARADEPVTVGLSNVRGGPDGVSGVITLRGAAVGQVDPARLRGTVDGATLPVTLSSAAHIERRTVLVIDTSGSMGQAGMATVRTAAATYLANAPADVLVGVVSFANTAGVDLAPTKDRKAVQAVVNGLASRGDTSLYAGVASAISALGTRGDRSIVLLSDGADTMNPDKAAARNALSAALRKAGIRVDVVRFKTNDPEATAALQSFASANGGSVVSAGDATAVDSAFRAAARAWNSQLQFHIATPRPLSGPHSVRLEGWAGSKPFVLEQPVAFAAVKAPSGPVASAAPTTPSQSPHDGSPAPSLTARDSQSWFPWVAAGFLGLGLFALAVSVTAPTFQTRREKRVAAIESYVAAKPPSRAESKAPQTALTEHLLGFGERAMKGRKSTTTTMALIDRADLPLRAGEWFVLRGIAVVIGAAGGAMLLGDLLFGLGVGAAFGLVLPPVALRFLAKRRALAFERILPDVLTLVATSLRSGFGLPQALDAVSRDAAEPAAKEFSRALAETRIGTEIPEALERMAERMDSTAMHWTVMAIRIQRDVGGNLADTLRTTAATLRERESIRRQVLALSAEGRLSAWILIALPIGVFFYLNLVSHEYVVPLWTTPIGIGMSLGALALMGVGIVWMQKIVKIEV